MLNSIGERMAFVRESITMTQDVIAPFLGMSQGNLSSIEAGKVSPTFITICCFSLLLDVYIDWLVLGEGEAPEIRRSFDSFVTFDRETFEPGKPKGPIPDDILVFLLKSFAQRLKFYRKQHNLSQNDIAAKIGMAQSSYSIIEKAKSNFSVEILEKILKGLELSGDWLLYGFETSQKGILFPSDRLICKKDIDLEELLKERLEHQTWKNSYKVYDPYTLSKEGIIPHRNLTVEQLNLVINLIFYLEDHNDKGTDVSKELELINSLIEDLRKKERI